MEVFVTGGTGFIGNELIRLLLAKGHSVLALTRNVDGKHLPKSGINMLQGDIRKKETLKAIRVKPEVIFHLAAEQNSQIGRTALLEANVEGTKNMLDFAVGRKVRGFIYASSTEAVGPIKENIVADEDYPSTPSTLYGESKKLAESLVREYGEKFNIDSISVRIGNVYGPGKVDSIIFPIADALLNKNKKLIQHSDTTCRVATEVNIQLIYVSDVALALIDMLNKMPNCGYDTYFVVGDRHNYGEYLRTVASLLGIESPPAYAGGEHEYNKASSDPRVRGGIHEGTYSGKRIYHDIGFVPETSLECGIAKTLVWYLGKGYLVTPMTAKNLLKRNVKKFLRLLQ